MSRPDARRVEVMDTTLRDGEQTPDVAYTPAEKLQIAHMLLGEVRVDRIEIASTRVSEGERRAARRITSWARKEGWLPRIEILGYCDGKLSVDWIASVGGRVINLLVKGSERHCRGQLGQAPEEHRARIEATLAEARRRRLTANVYLEDWSNGVRESFDYVFALVKLLAELGVERVYLPDTLGVLSPDDAARYVGLMTATWPKLCFEFHGHNDYGLATANCLAAVRAGARGIHTSVNGMGERSGNTCLAELVASLHDQTPYRTGVNEARLAAVARLVETFSGKAIAANAPIVGRDVFTQTAGIHADGDAKGELYASVLAPARFGRERRYALGKLSGRASLEHNLRALGIELTEEERSRVLRRVIELGDKKHSVVPEDLPYIIADVLKRPSDRAVRVESYRVEVASGELPRAEVEVSYGKRRGRGRATGDGGYDAFMRALHKAVAPLEIPVPRLVDFRVRIPPGGRTGALVETVITWQAERAAGKRSAQRAEGERSPQDASAQRAEGERSSPRAGSRAKTRRRVADLGEGTFSTLGVDSDQLAAAVIATEKMLNSVVARRAKAPRAARRRPPA